jgi:hypothetical protein
VTLGSADGASVVEVVTAADEYVGALIDHIADLLRCIQDGYAYVAEVTNIDGGDVRVRVLAKLVRKAPPLEYSVRGSRNDPSGLATWRAEARA